MKKITFLYSATVIVAPLILASHAWSSALQITPVTIQLPAATNAASINLNNPGKDPLYGQVRVFYWDQAKGEDVLTPTQELVASPPLIEIKPGAQQLVRLIKTDRVPAGQERAYRVIIDEIPHDTLGANSGVNMKLRYSVPVFVAADGKKNAPNIKWSLVDKGGEKVLHVENAGTTYAQLSNVSLVNQQGQAFTFSKGLLGYVLPQRFHEWRITPPDNNTWHGPLKITATINALQKIESPISKS